MGLNHTVFLGDFRIKKTTTQKPIQKNYFNWKSIDTKIQTFKNMDEDSIAKVNINPCKFNTNNRSHTQLQTISLTKTQHS